MFGKQLGEGREGAVYRLGNIFVIKLYGPSISSKDICMAVDYQNRASKTGASVEVLTSGEGFTIMSEIPGCHLLDLVKNQGFLSKEQQHALIDVHHKLETSDVYHNDADNLKNFMWHENQKRFIIIDFGLSKDRLDMVKDDASKTRDWMTWSQLNWILYRLFPLLYRCNKKYIGNRQLIFDDLSVLVEEILRLEELVDCSKCQVNAIKHNTALMDLDNKKKSV